jgi:biotin carboxylase
MREAKRQNWRVLLLTSEKLKEANWPRESIDDIFFMPDTDEDWKLQDVIYGVSYVARTEQIDRIVALDDYDVEKAASLREHLRIPGMGDTTARYFRDKLAMRARAKEVGIKIPDFVHVLNYDRIRDFISKYEFPFILKPRLHAGAIGIKKLNNEDELWESLEQLGDAQSYYLIELFVPGDIFHVDTIMYNHELQFSLAHEYGKPPMEVAHEGRVFTSKTMLRGSNDEQALRVLNAEVMRAMGLKQGISHTEFIKSEADGEFYFLETSARVGGANIAELVDAATGINLWAEWAKIETLPQNESYSLPEEESNYGGIILSLAKQQWPDMLHYDDDEIFWKLSKEYHAGIIVKSNKKERVDELISNYTERFYNDFFTSAPIQDKPTN